MGRPGIEPGTLSLRETKTELMLKFFHSIVSKKCLVGILRDLNFDGSVAKLNLLLQVTSYCRCKHEQRLCCPSPNN